MLIRKPRSLTVFEQLHQRKTSKQRLRNRRWRGDHETRGSTWDPESVSCASTAGWSVWIESPSLSEQREKELVGVLVRCMLNNYKCACDETVLLMTFTRTRIPPPFFLFLFLFFLLLDFCLERAWLAWRNMQTCVRVRGPFPAFFNPR